mgnify:CR=1 FL=1
MITRVNRAKEGFADYLISGARKDSIYTRDQKDKTITLYGNLQTFKQTEKYLNKYKNYESNYIHITLSFSQEDMNKLAAVKKYNADAVFVGSDWKGTDTWIKYEKQFAEVGCTVVYLDHTDGISSTILREKLNKGEQAL